MKRISFLTITILFIFGIVQAQNGNYIPAKGFTIDSAHGYFHLHEFTRHAVGDNDILIGEIKETQEIDKAYRNVTGGKVKFRYVINMNTL